VARIPSALPLGVLSGGYKGHRGQVYNASLRAAGSRFGAGGGAHLLPATEARHRRLAWAGAMPSIRSALTSGARGRPQVALPPQPGPPAGPEATARKPGTLPQHRRAGQVTVPAGDPLPVGGLVSRVAIE
jgi:hypothetical protein